MLPENILFATHAPSDLQSFLQQKKYSQVAVLVDENTHKHCYPVIQPGLPAHSIIEVKSGEEQKNLGTCEIIWQQMTDLALDRHAVLIVLGGGVLGDMGGFCAATYKRGIDFILIPTTLLAQVDASIGGKLGVDFNHLKNHIGVFQQPVLTLLHSVFLKTLPQPELRSGFAEIIKHCLTADATMWDEIRTRTFQDQNWDILTKHSVAFKARVTSEDPKEKGLRKILNSGHTIGHAVESHLLGAGHRILHGEAIAIGLIAEGFIAKEKGFLSPVQLHEITAFVLTIFGKINLSNKQIEEAAQLAVQDKKNRDNRILCVLLRGIGSAQWDVEITPDEIKTALTYYQGLQI